MPDGKDSKTAIIVAIIAAGATISAALLSSSKSQSAPSTKTDSTSADSGEPSTPQPSIVFDKKWEGSMWRAMDRKDNRDLYVTLYRIDTQNILTGKLRVVIEEPGHSCWDLYEFNAAPTDDAKELNVEVAPVNSSCGGLGPLRQALRSAKHGTMRVESTDFLRARVEGVPSIIDEDLVFGRSNENGDILQ